MMERGTPRDIRPDPRFLDLHAANPKVTSFLRDIFPRKFFEL